MKQIFSFTACLLVLLTVFFACAPNEDVYGGKVESIIFSDDVPTSVDEGDDLGLLPYLLITPQNVADTVSVTWTSSNKEIATVSNGYVQALREGSVTITAQAMDKETSTSILVNKVSIKEFSIPTYFEVYVGSKVKFPISEVSPKRAPLYRFEWESTGEGPLPKYNEGNWYLKADQEREYTLTASVDKADDATCSVKFVNPSISKAVFSPNAYTLERGASLSLKSHLQLTPIEGFNADTVKVTWSSNKPTVATVNASGKVEGLTAGKATITAMAGGKRATCTVTVTAPNDEENTDPSDPLDPSDPSDPSDPETPQDPNYPKLGPTIMVQGHECVDLGLSVKWAMTDVGATRPYDNGDKYAWGETFTRTSSSMEGYSYNDNPEVLPLSRDAANAAWGGNWRMPTAAEVSELLENCTITAYQHPTISAERGLILTSKKNGNSIFFARCTEGFYWTSTIYDGWNVFAKSFETRDADIIIDAYRRYTIRKIRAVCK